MKSGGVRSEDSPTRIVHLVHLNKSVKWPEARAIVRYISEFGTGKAQAHSRDSGWAIAVAVPTDLSILLDQHNELIESVEEISLPTFGGGKDIDKREGLRRQIDNILIMKPDLTVRSLRLIVPFLEGVSDEILEFLINERAAQSSHLRAEGNHER